MPISVSLKVACYELQQVRPQSDLENMREISLLMEQMLQSVVTGKVYETQDGIAYNTVAIDDGTGRPPLSIKKTRIIKGKPYVPPQQ